MIRSFGKIGMHVGNSHRMFIYTCYFRELHVDIGCLNGHCIFGHVLKTAASWYFFCWLNENSFWKFNSIFHHRKMKENVFIWNVNVISRQWILRVVFTFLSSFITDAKPLVHKLNESSFRIYFEHFRNVRSRNRLLNVCECLFFRPISRQFLSHHL